MFTKFWKPDIKQEHGAVAVPTDSWYQLWCYYMESTNDRQHVHPDDDLWGLNTYVLGQQFWPKEQLATNGESSIQIFRECVVALLVHKNLYMSSQDALTVYGEEYEVKDQAGLARLGVVFDIHLAVDLTIMVTVQRSDPHFDYFFVCKLLQIQIVDIGPFLEYQLRESFDRNVEDFGSFLSGLSIQYSPERSGKKLGMPTIIPEIQGLIMDKIQGLKNADFQKTNTPENMKMDQSSPAPADDTTMPQDTFPKWSNRQWAVFITTSLETFGLNIKSEDHVSNVARMLSVMLGKEVKDIGGAELYKRINEVLTLKNPQKLKDDFVQVKTYFQKVKWAQAVENIDLKINALVNKNKKIKS